MKDFFVFFRKRLPAVLYSVRVYIHGGEGTESKINFSSSFFNRIDTGYSSNWNTKYLYPIGREIRVDFIVSVPASE